VDALATHPDRLLSLVAALPEAQRNAVVAQALGRAIADLTREAALPLVRAAVEAEVPRRVARALEAACERMQTEGWMAVGLHEYATRALRTALETQIKARVATLTAGLLDRVRLEVDRG